MCGFAGLVALDGGRADAAIVERMSGSIRHRGPDDDGLFVEDGVALAFRRLSILDLSPSGHQPMESADGRAVVVFNGEIFNYVELRRELEDRGHAFRSSGDTEVLLAAWQEWGRECLPRLNGMWAFLVYDRARRRIFGSRDRFGIKPLYFSRRGDRLLFASEVKAIRASGLFDGGPNWEVAADYLVRENLNAGDEGAATFFEGIEQVRPATGFEIDVESGRWTDWRFWSLSDFAEEECDDAPERFAELFEDSVRIRLRSDVPVGVCLSGGLDSTSIVCAMARQRAAAGMTEPVEAFSYNASAFDETRFVDDTIAQTGAALNRIHLPEAIEWCRLPDILWFYDQPVYSTTPLVGYELMGLARSKGVTVVLNGQGADETIAGYVDYFRQQWHTLLARLRLLEAWREVRAFASGHDAEAGALFREALRRCWRTQLRRLRPYRSLAHKRQRRAARGNPWFDGALVAALPDRVPPFEDFDLRSGLERSVERAPLPLYLRVEDRNSMAHSVESRLPFLDYRLVAFLFGLPGHWKVRGSLNKFVLREAMRGRIPESVRARVDKMGFPTMARDWFAGPWYEPMQDLLASRETRERGIFKVEALRAGLERHRKGEIDLAHPLLTNVAQVELWLRGLSTDPVEAQPAGSRPG